MELFRIENLSFQYPTSEDKILDDINLSIKFGDFVVVCGQTGCGKTTFLKMLKRELTPHGKVSGEIFYNGIKLVELDAKTAACDIGYVLQNPENQVVTDKVWHEMAFGLENMGLSTAVIRRRVGEMASYFGIEEWFRSNTGELSGGQKQLLNLASIMVMQPKVLILDEPTSQLDPIAAADFIGTLQKLNRELGLTIILVEHRLEDVFPIADKVLILENGSLLMYEDPHSIAPKLKEINPVHPMLLALPSASRIYGELDVKCTCPLTVKDGRNFLSEYFEKNISQLEKNKYCHNKKTVVELDNVWFRYEKDTPDVLRGVSLQVFEGEIYCILGGNGAGKTTTLNVLSGINKAYRGHIEINGRKMKDFHRGELYRYNIAFLPQNTQIVFLKETVLEDFEEACDAMEYDKQEKDRRISDVCDKLDIHLLIKKHPYDLSGGEQQKCAIAKLLLLRPKILLLDEPTKGLDAFSKQGLSKIISDMKNEDITIIIVTHDVEFAASNGDRCSMFFDGEIISEDTPDIFFALNSFYTTAANRIARHMYPNCVTCEDVIELCKINGVRT